jgi:dTDP-4-amino-4,6-dideoxygalactose transaminase
MGNIFHRVISASLSPNTERDDVWKALVMLFSPWKWQYGNDVSTVERWLEKRFTLRPVTFNSGRSALLALLRAFEIGRGDEVIIQAFTCVAVPNSILWAGAIPVYADIDDSYNIDPTQLERKITKRTKAIIVQHTFGMPAKRDEITSVAKRHNLLIIEDFAHTMNLPLHGDAAFFSFGRDKVISSVWGGAAIISQKHHVPSEKLKKYHKTLPMPGMFWIVQQLLHPIAFSIILPLYNLGVGKLILVILQTLKLLSFPVYAEEKQGKRPADFPAKYPNALASLLVSQLKKLERFTKTRRDIATLYGRQGSYVRFPMLVGDPERVRKMAKRRGILLGNWYHNVIDPVGVNWEAVKYEQGSCPKAEEAARHMINLPTRVTEAEAKQIRLLFHTP